VEERPVVRSFPSMDARKFARIRSCHVQLGVYQEECDKKA
jgi:hypothetical protein